MADLGEEIRKSGVFGGVEFNNNEENQNINTNTTTDIDSIQNAGTIRNVNLPAQIGFLNKVKSLCLRVSKGFKIELTPYQHKVLSEVHDFWHQEITWEKVHDFLFQEISFRKKD